MHHRHLLRRILPKPRRRDSGAVMMLVAIGLAFLMVGAALGVEHGRITTNRRNLQKIADVAAMDATAELDGATTAELRDDVEAAVLDSTFRNQFIEHTGYTFTDGRTDVGDGKAIEYVIGFYDTFAREFEPTADNEVPNAVEVAVTDDFGFQFQPGGSTSTMDATAMQLLPRDLCTDRQIDCDPDPPCPESDPDCEDPDPQCPEGDPNCEDPDLECPEGDPDCEPLPDTSSITFTLGSFVAAFEADSDPAEAQLQRAKTFLYNAILGNVLAAAGEEGEPLEGEPIIPPTQLAIDAVGYQGLAQTWITLDDLRAVLGFGTVSELMDAQIDLPTWINAIGEALQLPARPALPPTGNSYIDKPLNRAAGQLSPGAETLDEVSPSVVAAAQEAFDDPWATALEPQPDDTMVVAAASALETLEQHVLAHDENWQDPLYVDGHSVTPRKLIRVDNPFTNYYSDLFVVRAGMDHTVADAQLNVLDLVFSTALIDQQHLASTNAMIPVSSPTAPTLDAELLSVLPTDYPDGLPSLLTKQLARIEARYPDRPDVVAQYNSLTEVFPPETELLSAELDFYVIEPPVTVFGPPGRDRNGDYYTFAETAQINLQLTLEIPAINLDDILVPAGVDPSLLTDNYTDMELPFLVSGGSAFAGVERLECATDRRPSYFDVSTETMRVSIADPEDLTVLNPVRRAAHLLTTSLGLGTVEMTGLSDITVPGIAVDDYEVTAPYNDQNRHRIAWDPVDDVGNRVINALDVSTTVAGLTSPITDPAAVDNKTRDELRARLAALEQDVISTINSAFGTGAFGVGLGGADLTVSDIACGQVVLIDPDEG